MTIPVPPRRRLPVAVLAAAALAASAPSAVGITSGGSVDGSRHPNVGAMLEEVAPDLFSIDCSVTLVAPTVVVTASHCTSFALSNPDPDFVTFDDDLNDGFDVIPATPVTNPRYRKGFRDDISVMVLSQAVTGIAPASLPPLGYLATLGLRQSSRFTMVGYGSKEKTVPGPPAFPIDGRRWFAVGSFNGLTTQWMKLSQNPPHGDAGTCYGDSGGPTFVGAGAGEGRTVVAVTSTGDTGCTSTSVNSRTDTPSARAFLSRFGV